MGFLVRWTQRAVRSQWFEHWTFEDVLSEAFLRADFLLTNKYDSAKGTPTVFLGSCLRTDLAYTYQRFLGRTIHWVPKENGGRRRTWVQRAPSVDCLDSIAPGVEADRPVDFSDIELSPRERKIIFYIMENRTRADIADRLGISASRVGQIITEQIRPKIHEWIKAEATRDKEIPESGTNKRAV